METKETGTHFYSMRIPVDLRHRLKLAAVYRNTTATAIIIEALEKELKEETKK